MIAHYLARKGWRETEQDKDTCHLWLQNSVQSIQYDNLNKDSGKYIYSYNRATTSYNLHLTIQVYMTICNRIFDNLSEQHQDQLEWKQLDFISRYSDFITCNGDFISCSSDFKKRNCEKNSWN